MSRLAGVLILLSAGAAAAAPKPRVAVVRVEFEGRVPEASQVFLSERLVAGLAAAGFEVTAGEVLRRGLKSGPAPSSCRVESCYRDIAQRLAVDYLLAATVRTDRKNYEVRLELIGGDDGRRRVEARDRCELCGIQEVGQKLDSLASSLSSSVAPATPPSPEPLPETSPRLDVPAPSPPSVVVAMPAASPAEPASRATPWRALGWTAVVVGLAATVAGGIVMALDGRTTACPEGTPIEAACHTNTRLPAGLLLGGGIVGAGMGGLVLYFD